MIDSKSSSSNSNSNESQSRRNISKNCGDSVQFSPMDSVMVKIKHLPIVYIETKTSRFLPPPQDHFIAKIFGIGFSNLQYEFM